MTLSGVQMARFIYGMALWCLLDKGPEIITCCYPWNDSPQACVRRQRQIMVFLVGLWAASIFGMTLLISTCVRFRPLLCQMKCVIIKRYTLIALQEGKIVVFFFYSGSEE